MHTGFRARRDDTCSTCTRQIAPERVLCDWCLDAARRLAQAAPSLPDVLVKGVTFSGAER